MKILKTLSATGALLLPLAAQATGHAYLGGSFGNATTAVDDATITNRLANAGLPGSAKVSDTSRPGWRLFGGYGWNRYFALEGGYTNLGTIGMTLTGTGNPTADQLKQIRPGSGSGLELAAVARYPFSERIDGLARAGLFHWSQSYKTNSGSGTFSGDDALLGLGAEWRVNDRWSARLSWDRYTVAKDQTTLLALGVTYRFFTAAEKPVAPVEIAAPVVAPPEPVAAPAPVQEEPVAQTPPVETPRAIEPAPEPQRWTIPFAFKRTKLIGQEATLDTIAAHLATHPDARVQITGHTDASGAEDFNPYLSRLRAKAVADALAARGVERARITVEGKGRTEPLADNKHRTGRAQNRRVEVVIYPEERR